MFDATARPFTARLHTLHRHLTYDNISRKADRVRSLSWFYDLMTSRQPWAVSPPPPGCVTGLAKLFECTEREVRELIAAEWHGVPIPPGAPSLAVQLASLDDETLCEVLANAFSQRAQPGSAHDERYTA